ncbi:MAG: hypothetical protein ABIT20_01130 [Gemmatimonadaceae bacterium]
MITAPELGGVTEVEWMIVRSDLPVREDQQLGDALGAAHFCVHAKKEV